MDTSPPVKRIWFVCTGNTCRSPMAATMFRHLAEKAGLTIEALSAGVGAAPGAPASPGAIRAMQKRGLNLEGHLAQLVSDAAMQDGDLVLTMTKGQRESVLKTFPALAGQVHVLRDFVGASGDVTDPFGGPDCVYQQCADELYALMQRLIAKLQDNAKTGTETGSQA